MADQMDIATAAVQLGLTETAVRKRLRRGTLAGGKDATGRWYVTLPRETDGVPPAVPDPLVSALQAEEMQVVLIHGGLYGEMDADRFWEMPGIAGDLRQAGVSVLTPDRMPRPTTWRDEAAYLATLISQPAVIVAGSNGCSAAVRLAIDHADRVTRLVLCWPATCGEPTVDGPARRNLRARGVPPATIEALLSGETLRGVADHELVALRLPVTVVPSQPENIYHQRRTVAAFSTLIRSAEVSDGFPESPHPAFASQRRAFVDQLLQILAADPMRSYLVRCSLSLGS